MDNPSKNPTAPAKATNGACDLVEVEVEFDYEAELGDELTIRVGDVIKDVKRMSGGWWEGLLNGKRGLFPDNFVKVLSKDLPRNRVVASGADELVHLRSSSQKKTGTTVAAKKRCRVLYSYQPQHEDELELNVDDIVDFISEVEDGWWKGTLHGQTGVFPSNFVELLRTSMAVVDTSKESTSNAGNVADKNKKNEKLKVSGRITSLIQDVESKSSKKKSTENLNLVRKESPISNLEANDKPKIDNIAPKLPPKPVKEQCRVLFPYTAMNDDELTLEEGQIINIVTKEVEDKGWWKGELDGKIGVFPDNFVRLITTAEASPSEEAKSKKPGRPPTSGTAKHRDSADDSPSSLSSKNSSREQLNGSQSSNLDRSGSFGNTKSPVKKTGSKREDKPGATLSGLPSGNTGSPKKHSFGKATPPPKPKPPAPKLSTTKEEDEKLKRQDSRQSIKKPAQPETPEPEKSATKMEPQPNNKSSDQVSDLDAVTRGDRLSHPTAERVKAPKRRPPSSVFIKESKLSGNAFEALALDDVGDVAGVVEPETMRSGRRSSSQGSVFSLDDKENEPSKKSPSRHEDKNRRSFKLVKQMKEAFSGLTHSNNDNKSNESKHIDKEDKPKAKMPPPKPPLPASLITNSSETPAESDKKKPDWLEELSRKQANRRSGVFPENPKTEQSSTGVPSNHVRPAVTADKPFLPVKPSQIRDDARKSMVFGKREDLTPTNSQKPVAEAKPAFVRQLSKNEIRTTDKKAFSTGALDERKSLLDNTNVDKLRISAVDKPVPEKPAENSQPTHVEKVSTDVDKPSVVNVDKTQIPSVEKLHLSKVSENVKTESDKSTVDTTAKKTTPTHFVGGWKVPSPTKEIQSPTKELQSPLKETQSSTREVSKVDESTLADRVHRLETLVDEIRAENLKRLDEFRRMLEDERSARIRAETELQLLKKNLNS